MNLIEVSTHKIRTTDETTWYSSEEKEHKDEVLNRLIIWDDCFDYWENDSTGSDEEYEGGTIEFSVYNKAVYDKIFEYFNLHSDPTSFTSALDVPIQFNLSTRKYITKWTCTMGTISCYHRWFSNIRLKDAGTNGRIAFEINDKKLFEKFRSFAVKFKP